MSGRLLVRVGTYCTLTGAVPLYRPVEPRCKYPGEKLRRLRADRGVGVWHDEKPGLPPDPKPPKSKVAA